MGRAIVVGDKNQAIYRFRGADSNAFESIREMLTKTSIGVKSFELPVNYRCDQFIIENAQRLVPALQGFSKCRGTVDIITFSDSLDRVNNENKDIILADGIDGEPRELTDISFAFLCRTNLPLLVTAYSLMRMRKMVCIVGKAQIAGPLKRIIEELCGDPKDKGFIDLIYDKNNNRGLLSLLDQYQQKTAERMSGDERSEEFLETLYENCDCIRVVAAEIKDNSVRSLLNELDSLFSEEPKPGVITLSTVHRSKGLEWNVVFLLRPDLLPHPAAKTEEDQQQELNAEYVAYTRAKNRFYYVDNWREKGKNIELIYERPEFPSTAILEENVSTATSQTQVPPQVVAKFVDDGEPF